MMFTDLPNITILAATDPAVIADQYQAALNKIIAIAIGNYAMIKGIDSAIASNLKILGDVNADVANIKIDNQKIKAISNQIQVCIKLPKTIADPDPAKPGNVIPNPAYIQCGKDVKTMVVQAKLSINNPEIVAELANTEAKLNALVDSYDYNSVWNQFITFVNDPDKWVRDKFFGAILDAWSYVINQTTDEGFILSILALPMTLAFSFINTKPLEIWFSSLWGLGIFKFSLTILSGCIAFINANLIGSVPVFGLELCYAFGAPIIAGIIAKGGGDGLLALMAQVSTELIGGMKTEVTHKKQ